MFFVGRIWEIDILKKEIYYTAKNDIDGMIKLSAAVPNGCRATYEEINEKTFKEKTQIKSESTTEKKV